MSVTLSECSLGRVPLAAVDSSDTSNDHAGGVNERVDARRRHVLEAVRVDVAGGQ